MGKLENVTTTQNSQQISLKFSGNITENCEIFSLDLRDKKSLEIDFSSLQYINSVGVKAWVQWSHQKARHLNVVLKKCTVLFINQVNLVVGFLPKNFVIESFYIPYFCEKCGTEKLVLLQNEVDFFKATKDSPKKVILPSKVRCDKDDLEMELDIIYSKYFSFLDGNKS